jgi:ribosomal protein S20
MDLQKSKKKGAVVEINKEIENQDNRNKLLTEIKNREKDINQINQITVVRLKERVNKFQGTN